MPYHPDILLYPARAVAVQNRKRDRDYLEKELQCTTDAFKAEYKSISSSWGARLGPVAVNATVSAETIIAIFVSFNLACLAAGIALTLQKGVLQALGISLIVGGLFSFGTFTAQWWDHAWQRRNKAVDYAFEGAEYEPLKRLYQEIQKLSKELENLPEPIDPEEDGFSKSPPTEGSPPEPSRPNPTQLASLLPPEPPNPIQLRNLLPPEIPGGGPSTKT